MGYDCGLEFRVKVKVYNAALLKVTQYLEKYPEHYVASLLRFDVDETVPTKLTKPYDPSNPEWIRHESGRFMYRSDMFDRIRCHDEGFSVFEDYLKDEEVYSPIASPEDFAESFEVDPEDASTLEGFLFYEDDNCGLLNPDIEKFNLSAGIMIITAFDPEDAVKRVIWSMSTYKCRSEPLAKDDINDMSEVIQQIEQWSAIYEDSDIVSLSYRGTMD